MRCQEAIRIIEREGAGDTPSLAAHLAGCEACRRALAAEQTLRAALAADPPREVNAGFEQRLFARIAEQAPVSPVGAWWNRLEFRLSWRFRPALVTAGGLALALGVVAVLPFHRGAPEPTGHERVDLPPGLVDRLPTPRDEERELVDYSIAQSTYGSISETH